MGKRSEISINNECQIDLFSALWLELKCGWRSGEFTEKKIPIKPPYPKPNHANKQNQLLRQTKFQLKPLEFSHVADYESLYDDMINGADEYATHNVDDFSIILQLPLVIYKQTKSKQLLGISNELNTVNNRRSFSSNPNYLLVKVIEAWVETNKTKEEEEKNSMKEEKKRVKSQNCYEEFSFGLS
ncbi:CLUMA_CG007013, isoform A [Clunio marinus]|uniref:CLUMA_CG007013, isoform A n=1 Tax=Clunio marinus TaxID=568069 RepID=A0A1J1HZM7_9DIPT|nr:CLUMA_CG007013, isoform A [Clunio marinus]